MASVHAKTQPETGTFSLNNDMAAGAHDQRFEFYFGGRTDHQSIVWNAVDGELRIEMDQKKGHLKGEFSAKFIQRSGDNTRTTQVTGQFDMR